MIWLNTHREHRMFRPTSLFILAIACWPAVFSAAFAQSVPFVIPGDDATETATDFSRLLHKPAGSKGFVKVRDGRFFAGEERIRFWGMNLCFGANFPTHDEANKVAPHLAKLGVNSVRFHHMDNQNAPGGIWKTNDDGSRMLDLEQLDRLDYFIAKLAENGVYSNINMHVSRQLTEGEGYPVMKGGPWWAASNKWVMYYDRDVQAEVKKYCTQLLTRPNKYRDGLKLADDPSVALIEMLNENFFSRQGTSLLRHLPDRFLKSFRSEWNRWLSSKYRSHNGLKSGWASKGGVTEALIKTEPWTDSIGDWKISAQGVKLTPKFVPGPKDGISAIRFEPEKETEQRHFQQFARRSLSVTAKQPYSLSFWIRADKKRELSVELSTTEGGRWRALNLFDVFEAGPEWKQVRHTIFPEETSEKFAYVAFSFGNDKTPIEIANVEFSSGISGKKLPEGQTLNEQTIGIPDGNFPLAAHDDLNQFMLDTERAWITEMKRYLREDCGVKVPITASQENYHGAGIAKDTVDYIDLHNYWHHPLFPSDAQWSPKRYTVGNVPIESFPLQEAWPARSLIIRTGWRYHGMPFTLSEWNHAEPSDVNTGVIMMAAVVGQLQDWDGVYFFDYESTHSQWFNKHFEGFFDFNSQPAKLAVFAAASNIFLRGDLSALKEAKSGTNEERLDGRLSFQYRLGIDFDQQKPDNVDIPKSLRFETPDRSVLWDATKPEQGYLQLNTPKSRGVWGLVGGRRFEVGGVTFDVQKVDRNYATMLTTSLDDKPIEQSKRLLILASSGAENTDMKWNADRTSVGDQWGSGPTLVNVVTGQVGLPIKSSKVFALDGTGKRIKEIPTKLGSSGLHFELKPEHKTIWYEVVAE